MLDWEASGVLFGSRGRGWGEEGASDAARWVRADHGIERLSLDSGDYPQPYCGWLGHSSHRAEAMRWVGSLFLGFFWYIAIWCCVMIKICNVFLNGILHSSYIVSVANIDMLLSEVDNFYVFLIAGTVGLKEKWQKKNKGILVFMLFHDGVQFRNGLVFVLFIVPGFSIFNASPNLGRSL